MIGTKELVSRHLQMNGQSVRKCAGDADTQIVAGAIDLAKNKCTNIFIADDTYVVILLLYHWGNDTSNVYFSGLRKQEKHGELEILSESLVN